MQTPNDDASSKPALDQQTLTVIGLAIGAAGVVLGAAITGGFGIYQTYVSASQQLELEKNKLEWARILEMIKTGDCTAAIKNLQFLIDTCLITDYSLRKNVSSALAVYRIDPARCAFLPKPSGDPRREDTGDHASPPVSMPGASAQPSTQTVTATGAVSQEHVGQPTALSTCP